MNEAVNKILKKYKAIIGLEVHAELKTESKMFCGCKNDPFNAVEPNIYTCPVCLGLPGALPVANKKAIEWTIKLGLALNCKINLNSKFDRKHYYYPDLPKGYQISQYDLPFCYEGTVPTSTGNIELTRIHLEEDTAKLIHKTIDGKIVSLIDFNRSSVPLIELVSEPVITSAAQAKEYTKYIRQVIRFLDIGDCHMQAGGMRLEANVSLIKRSDKSNNLPCYKVEIKNINSFKFLEAAINSEIVRQSEILDNGKIPRQETRGWDAVKNKSFSQRFKEEAEDYRYFPEPDLPPIRFTQKQIEAIAKELPELASQKEKRWHKDYQIDLRYAKILSSEKKTSELFDNLWQECRALDINPNDLAKKLVNKRIEWSETSCVKNIIGAYRSNSQTDDFSEEELKKIIKQVLKNNPDAVAKYKQGKKQVLGFLIGQIMKSVEKKLDHKAVQRMLLEELDG